MIPCAFGDVFINLRSLLLTIMLSGAMTSVVVRKEHGHVSMEVASTGEIRADDLGSSRPDHHFSWAALEFSACTICHNQSYKYRPVQCRDAFSGSLGDESECKGSKLNSFELCDCGLEVCEPKKADVPCPSSTDLTVPPLLPAAYEELGCFKFEELPGALGQTSRFDMTCINLTQSAKCRHGLPFYKFEAHSMAAKRCFDNCSTRGLDVFGIVGGKQCYCGASVLNDGILSQASPQRKQHLLFDTEALSKRTPQPPSSSTADLTECPLTIYRYSGPFEGGVLPEQFIGNISITDQEYKRTIASGHIIDEEAEEDGIPDEETNTTAASTNFIHMHSWDEARLETSNERIETEHFRNCWPKSCAAGKPWDTRTSKRPSLSLQTNEVWKEYVIIKYVFEEGLSLERRNTFRKAAERWHDKTCLYLVEQKTIPDNSFYVKVGVFPSPSNPTGPPTETGCWALGPGRPPFNTGYGKGENFSRIHMGWCRNADSLGNVMHEIGHILGLTHEQQRPDASSKSLGYGPYLIVYWDNIVQAGKVSSYRTREEAYVGSADDSSGSRPDPHVGHAPYDFQSIMHYGGTFTSDKPLFATIPADQAEFVGNRKFLTEHDIKAVNDMYQCIAHRDHSAAQASNPMIWLWICFVVHIVCAAR